MIFVYSRADLHESCDQYACLWRMCTGTVPR